MKMDLDRYTLPRDHSLNLSCIVNYNIRFVSEEEFERLKRPLFGYTTAKIRKWNYKTKGYYEVLVSYLKASLEYLKLTDNLTWKECLEETDLGFGKRVIKKFLEEKGFNNHDLRHIIEIVYWYKRKEEGILKEIEQKEKLIAKFGKVGEKSVEDILSPLLKGEDIEETMPGGCSMHPNFKGLRKNRNGCKGCTALYEANKASGIKETRGK